MKHGKKQHFQDIKQAFYSRVSRKNACVIYPVLPTARFNESSYRLRETIELAKAIDLVVVHSQWRNQHRVRAATFFGKGTLDTLCGIMREKYVDLCIVDGVLNAVQQRNLERYLSVKVIDRIALILEIFALKAKTFEGRLQADLALLNYQKSRLVRAWSHLERQRGGRGFVGGPGERQLEIDRRLFDKKIVHIRQKLEKVRRTRNLQARHRRNIYPVVALIGYTNAGKSTLFNRLTKSNTPVENRPFSTLDPTMRQITLPCRKRAILSDTVGFIQDLPHHLLAAFRATLEEVKSADVLLHVRDVKDPQFADHGKDVEAVLMRLGLILKDTKIIEVWNKSDTLDPQQKISMENILLHDKNNRRKRVLCSAFTDQDIRPLLDSIARCLGDDNQPTPYDQPHLQDRRSPD